MNLELKNGFFRSSFPRVPLALPFWNGETYQSILRCLIYGQVALGPDLLRLKKQIIDALGVAEVMPCGSGSYALELALCACGIGRGDEVVLPTFCCAAVVAPIVAVGATPVLADVGAELNLTTATVQAALTNKTKAVIVPHLFGNPGAIDAIVELAREKNIRVIDDAAQALGANLDGQAVGSFGDAGIISFGSEKVCSGVGGGVLVCRTAGIAARLAQARLPPPALTPAVKNLFSSHLARRGRRWSWPVSRFLSCDTGKDPNSPTEPYRPERMANVAAAVAASLMQSLQANLAARRVRVQTYCQLLSSESCVELVPHRPGSACLTQVIRLLPQGKGDERAAGLIRILRQAGYEVQGSYVPIHLLSQFDQCVWDRLPYADRVWPDLIELPCEPGISLADVERIAAIVNRVAGGG